MKDYDLMSHGEGPAAKYAYTKIGIMSVFTELKILSKNMLAMYLLFFTLLGQNT